ncbi:hypothetical protein [Methyloceanibacter caenitepidi]|uniref:Uncharacterized protein n=1 Tax=Methyloceanibacter caenitepidi TaxID=1384459 RepID=A0A0A8K1T5_9HYPH|nr:hypothetical protein [Methyloceanibacter caenitepidi]BAQ16903.1 hypothetical protein GL4_1447 [Methyloceanibacter caenitepidi]
MSNVSEWAVAAGNNDASPPDGAPEGMARSAVNDVMREMMAALARWYQDTRPSSLVTAGTGNAYTLTTNQGHTTLTDIPVTSFRVDRANTGAATLNIDGLGAKPWKKRAGLAYASGGLIPDQLVTVAYNATADRFETVGGQSGEFDSGAEMLFMAEPVQAGWLKDETANLDDTALRLTTGSPGSRTDQSSFSTVFARTKTDGHALTESQLATHDHPIVSSAFNVRIKGESNRYLPFRNSSGTGASAWFEFAACDAGGGISRVNGWAPSVDVGQLTIDATSTNNAGAGGVHDHDMDIRVNYHDAYKGIKE